MLQTQAKPAVVAIVGNPNAGKTTLFNALTGSHQKVGNYPGVTVERISGKVAIGESVFEFIDIPGLYSLKAVSEDERVAANAIVGEVAGEPKPDLLVCVVDASNIERNLFLYSQVAGLDIPMLVALTMVDRLDRKKLTLDIKQLSDSLGVEVIPVVGHKDKGIAELKSAIRRNTESPRVPRLVFGMSQATEAKVEQLRERMARIGEDVSRADLYDMLRDSDSPVATYARDFPELEEDYVAAAEAVQADPVQNEEASTRERYAWATNVANQVLTKPAQPAKKSTTDKLDAILTNRVWGFGIFLAVMYLVFQSIYSFSEPLMGGIEWLFGALGDWISPKLESVPILQSLVVDGLVAGVGGVLVFLPQIVVLFFFIAILEGTGYLARAAFMMDRLLGWCGLNGRAFIPLLSSFACAIPGIMAARVMPDAKARLATILVAPLMSCSARLPVYLLLIGIFVEPKFGPIWAGIALFAMHMVGLVISIPIVWILNRKLLKGKRLPFLLELPPYQWPKWKDVLLAMYFRGKVFVKTAGTIIVVMSIIIWAASYFPRSDEGAIGQAFKRQWTSLGKSTSDERFEAAQSTFVAQRQLENSYLGRFGRFLEPVFVPAGFDWRITTAILSAFPARETVVPSLGIIFSVGEDTDEENKSLRSAIAEATWPDGRPLMNIWTAIGLMVFFALCCQCSSTLAAIKRETNSWKWPVFVFFYMTTLAYISAVIIYQVGRLFGG